MNSFSVAGNLVDIFNKRIFYAEIFINNNLVEKIAEIAPDADPLSYYILPGFIDSHVHIESSMLVPSEFARLAVTHGTVGTVSDPHEIGNVCGMEGVEYMIENGKTVPFKFHFGAPSCVPATVFETAGASIDSIDIARLMARPEILYLSEMMNFPGVLNKDIEVLEKIAAAHSFGKPVDGHAPGLRGEQARQYIDAGISTDHECFTEEEALDKLQAGMKILIREGSAAKNFEALIGLLNEWPEKMMFCSDDKHPDSLALGHINQLCERAVAKGIDLFNVLRAACVNPVLHYALPVGLLREGDPADFILVNNLSKFQVHKTYINGELVAEDGQTAIVAPAAAVINQFSCKPLEAADLVVPFLNEKEIPVIEALDGQLITNRLMIRPLVTDNAIQADTVSDVLKIVVVNRYLPAPVAKGWIRNFGFKQGAIASTVAHDSHNIIAVGCDDASLARAINLVIAEQGGVSCVGPDGERILPLPVAGLMSNSDGYLVAAAYTEIDRMAKELGSQLSAPFMTLSFMALLVIPHLKLSDKGLFDGDGFCFVSGPMGSGG